MGNSPSQEVVEGAHGEPDDFNLDTISQGSDDEAGRIPNKKNALTCQSKSTASWENSSSSASAVKPGLIDANTPKADDYFLANDKTPHARISLVDQKSLPTPPSSAKEPNVESNTDNSQHHSQGPNVAVEITPDPLLHVSRSVTEPKESILPTRPVLYDYNSPPPVNEDQEMQDSEKISSKGKDPMASSRRYPKRIPPETSTKNKRKRDPLTVEDAPIAQLKRRRRQDPPKSGLEALEHDAALEITDKDESPRRKEMATSTAKRNFPFVVKKVGENSPNIRTESDDDDNDESASDYVTEEDDEEDVDDADATLLDAARKTKNTATVKKRFVRTFDGCHEQSKSGPAWTRHERQYKEQGQPQSTPKTCPISGLKRPPKTPQASNSQSIRDFEVNESESESDKPQRPRAKSRLSKNRCLDCDEGFKSRAALKKHEQKAGHGASAGDTGRFSDVEVRKLEKYKRDFCAMYDIDGHYFNDMMTESCRRSALHKWPYAFITKAEFLTQYFEVLPNRKRKSMARYRERNWQNANGIKDWTNGDDDEIVRLVEELGPKWVEIGQRLTRTQDAVQQRWKKFLQFRVLGVEIRRGPWSAEENAILEKAIIAAKKRAGLAQDQSTDKQVAWSLISDTLGNARTPKQCADRWHDIRTTQSTSRRAYTKSGQRLSSLYVLDSDEDLDRPEDGNEDGDEDVDIEKPSVVAKAPESIRDVAMPDTEITETLSDGEQGQEYTAATAMQSDKDEPLSATQSGRKGRQEQVTQKHGHISSASPSPNLHEKTPAKITTLSQAFANTQANASALRRPSRLTVSPRADRPSPRIPIQLRGMSPVIQETPAAEERLEDLEARVLGTQGANTWQASITKQGQRSTKPESMASVTESDETESESDEEEEVFGVSKKRGTEKGAEIEPSEDGSEETEESTDVQNAQELETIMPTQIGNREPQHLAGEAGETDSTSESGSDTDSISRSNAETRDDESSDDETTSTSASRSDDDDSDDSMIEDTKNDFMESIKQSARKAELAKQQRSKLTAALGISDSEGESDDEDQDIEHG